MCKKTAWVRWCHDPPDPAPPPQTEIRGAPGTICHPTARSAELAGLDRHGRQSDALPVVCLDGDWVDHLLL
eukprot:22107-Eustigmatos_ZCMA.PRE.1